MWVKGFGHVIYKIQNEMLIVEVDSCGAEWKSVTDKKTQKEYLWNKKIDAWQYCAPILFPVIGRLKNDSYQWDGEFYSMPKHGFCFDLPFEVHQQKKNKITFVLSETLETFAIYPFRFQLVISYTLKERSLVTSFIVTNQSEYEMYFSLGTHPSFCCNQWDKLEFEYPETIPAYRMNDEYLLDGRRDEIFNGGNEIILDSKVFQDGALIFPNLRSKFVILKSAYGKPRIQMELCAPYLGIWSIPGEDYICIEPWFGIDDFTTHNGKIEEKRGICTLKPQEEFSYDYLVTFYE